MVWKEFLFVRTYQIENLDCSSKAEEATLGCQPVASSYYQGMQRQMILDTFRSMTEICH